MSSNLKGAGRDATWQVPRRGLVTAGARTVALQAAELATAAPPRAPRPAPKAGSVSDDPAPGLNPIQLEVYGRVHALAVDPRTTVMTAHPTAHPADPRVNAGVRGTKALA